MANEQEFVSCNEAHPKTGDVCSLPAHHVENSDPRVKQHVTKNGSKWSTLNEIDPTEGWNDFVTYKQ